MDELAGEYRRRARRIRAAGWGNPVKTQHELQRLNHPSVAEPQPQIETLSGLASALEDFSRCLPRRGRMDWSASAVLGERGPAARNFADLVAARLVQTILPWSDRQALLREADKRNITRFEANLIIAAVQHHLELGRRPAATSARHPAAKLAAWTVGVAAIAVIIVLSLNFMGV